MVSAIDSVCDSREGDEKEFFFYMHLTFFVCLFLISPRVSSIFWMSLIRSFIPILGWFPSILAYLSSLILVSCSIDFFCFTFMLLDQRGWLSSCLWWGGRTRAFSTNTPNLLRGLRMSSSRLLWPSDHTLIFLHSWEKLSNFKIFLRYFISHQHWIKGINLTWDKSIF